MRLRVAGSFGDSNERSFKREPNKRQVVEGISPTARETRGSIGLAIFDDKSAFGRYSSDGLKWVVLQRVDLSSGDRFWWWSSLVGCDRLSSAFDNGRNCGG